MLIKKELLEKLPKKTEGAASNPPPLQTDSSWASWILTLTGLRRSLNAYTEARSLQSEFNRNVFLSDGSIDTATVEHLRELKLKGIDAVKKEVVAAYLRDYADAEEE